MNLLKNTILRQFNCNNSIINSYSHESLSLPTALPYNYIHISPILRLLPTQNSLNMQSLPLVAFAMDPLHHVSYTQKISSLLQFLLSVSFILTSMTSKCPDIQSAHLLIFHLPNQLLDDSLVRAADMSPSIYDTYTTGLGLVYVCSYEI